MYLLIFNNILRKRLFYGPVIGINFACINNMTIMTDDLRDMRISIIFSCALILFALACLMLPSKALPASFGQSHETHWWDDRGPKFWTTFPNPPMGCTNCHYDDTPHHGNPYQFADMQDLANTTVCDDCHSKNGAYDGVAVAKANWDSGIYTGDNLEYLPSGKEQWCVTCHDDAAPAINGVTAKNISGNDITYGYFTSGHGKYNVFCTDCHDPRLIHFDGYDKTYDAEADENGPRGYQKGYRLQLIDSQLPLDIPRTASYAASQFALCYSCHNEEKTIYSNFNNFVELSGPTNYQVNYHAEDESGGGNSAHLFWQNEFWDSDSDGDYQDSRFSCPTCHNPHGKNYDGHATFSMTRNDMGIVHKREVLRVSGYMERGDWEISGGDLFCFGCHNYGPTYEYYYRLGTPPPETPAFWTKLDSENDVTAPTYGTGGTLIGGDFANYTFYGDTKTGLSIINTNEGCEFPASNLNKNNDTIEFWYIPNFNFSGNTTTRYLLDNYYDANNWIRIGVTNDKMDFRIRNAGTTYTLTTTSLTWQAGTPHHIVCTYGPAQAMHMYLDRVEPSYSTSTGLTYLGGINSLPQYFYVGIRYDGTLPAFGIIDDFKIYGYQYQKFESDPFLFSKLGSATEVQSPVSGNGGIVSGSVSFTSARQQHLSSALFNSTYNGAVQFPTSNLNPSEDTIDLWYYPNFDPAGNADTTKHLFYCSKDADNFALIKLQNNELRFRIRENSTDHTLQIPLEDGQVWYHIACTYGPDGMHIYINDKEAAHDPGYTGGLWDGVLPAYFQIGNRAAGQTQYCNGYIDELRVYGYQGSPSYLEFLSECPVDIQVIDPLGRIVDRFQNEIQGAQYLEQDFNHDGSPDDKIVVPKRNGTYTFSVFAEPGANPEDTYTLKVKDGENTIVLVRDDPVGNIAGENKTYVTVTSSGLKFINLLGPGNGETLSGASTFDWESVGYDGFKLQFSADNNFKRKGISLPNQKWTWLPDTIYTPTDKEWKNIKKLGRKGRNIYWRVIGIDAEGNIGSSQTRSFILLQDLTRPRY